MMSQLPPQLTGMAGPQMLQGGAIGCATVPNINDPANRFGGGIPTPGMQAGPDFRSAMGIDTGIGGGIPKFGSFPTSQAQPPPANPFLTGELAPSTFDPFAGLMGLQNPQISTGVNNNLVAGGGVGGLGGGGFAGPQFGGGRRGLLGQTRRVR